MEFMTFLAAIGIVVSTFLLGFFIAGLHETGPESDNESATSVALTALVMLFVAVCTAFILVEPALINPLWLQYTLMAGVPLVVGYILRRALAKSMDSTQQ
ncbi:MAG TPA: hypothetical protein DCY59_07605 [Micrococcaceae bacterium]|jgi:ABC-type uncharacterized transport system permease subunit|nr:hypothetical protein [Micrococcaceae bacterium]